VDEISFAGLERPLVAENNPYVIKSPWFIDGLMEALEKQLITIYAAIVPVRDLFEAAESSRREDSTLLNTRAPYGACVNPASRKSS
jgi:hypothetical protein